MNTCTKIAFTLLGLLPVLGHASCPKPPVNGVTAETRGLQLQFEGTRTFQYRQYLPQLYIFAFNYTYGNGKAPGRSVSTEQLAGPVTLTKVESSNNLIRCHYNIPIRIFFHDPGGRSANPVKNEEMFIYRRRATAKTIKENWTLVNGILTCVPPDGQPEPYCAYRTKSD